MKKLIIAAAIVCAAALSQAANVNWAAGTLYMPNADGSIGSTDGTGKWVFTDKVGTSYNVKMYVWEALAENAVSYDSGELFKWYQNGAKSDTDPFGNVGDDVIKALNGTYDGAKSAANVSGIVTGTPSIDTIYGSVLFVLEGKISGDAVWYMENSAAKVASTTEVKATALAMFEGGDVKADHMVWQSVPEPTSGLLLLLGVAGLALRRRRA